MWCDQLTALTSWPGLRSGLGRGWHTSIAPSLTNHMPGSWDRGQITEAWFYRQESRNWSQTDSSSYLMAYVHTTWNAFMLLSIQQKTYKYTYQCGICSHLIISTERNNISLMFMFKSLKKLNNSKKRLHTQTLNNIIYLSLIIDIYLYHGSRLLQSCNDHLSQSPPVFIFFMTELSGPRTAARSQQN